jgi:hypothetical protein
MTMSTLLWILGIGVVFYLMRKSGGGCCGGNDHGNKENHGNSGNSDHTVDSDQSSIQKNYISQEMRLIKIRSAV